MSAVVRLYDCAPWAAVVDLKAIEDGLGEMPSFVRVTTNNQDAGVLRVVGLDQMAEQEVRLTHDAWLKPRPVPGDTVDLSAATKEEFEECEAPPVHRSR